MAMTVTKEYLWEKSQEANELWKALQDLGYKGEVPPGIPELLHATVALRETGDALSELAEAWAREIAEDVPA